MKKYAFTAIALSGFIVTGCGTAADSNGNNGNRTNSNVLIKVDANNLPPGLSASPISPSTNSTPGIPAANAVNVPKGATPTPGIPDPKNAGKPMKPGATPTPGIPDAETIRRQMQQQRPVNANVPPPSDGGSMMRKRPPANANQ